MKKRRTYFERNVRRIDLPGGRSGRRLLRIALVADLHDHPCPGLAQAVRDAQPDLIAIAGDLMECPLPPDAPKDPDDWYAGGNPLVRAALHVVTAASDAVSRLHPRRPGNEQALAFLREAVRIAPVCYALGNHERGITPAQRVQVLHTGAALLDGAFIRLQVGACEAIVGGLTSRMNAGWLDAFAQAEGESDAPVVRVLLCHRPEYYDRYDLPGDVILAGHAHGGQWRLLGRPVFAPGQGLFPHYAEGVHDGRLVVSRGLANTACLPRLGNPPELVIVDVFG